MDRKEIEQKVTFIVSEQMGLGAEEIKPESKFVGDLGADSLDSVELAMALEEEFNIEIPDEDIEKMETVEDAIKYVETAFQKATKERGTEA